MTLGNVMCIVLMLSAQYPVFATSVSENQPRGCLCPDETLEFECTIEGGGTTVWEGTLLTCPPSNSIQIDHIDSFEPVERSVSYICHNQSINATVWFRLEGENNYYSRLSVSRLLLPNLSSSTVKCTYDNGSHEIDVHTWTVIDPLSPPTNISLQHANTTHLSFSWDPAILSSDCSSLQYDIHTTNCGTCPSISTLPFFVCENVDITTDVRVCSVAVQARCGNTAGNMSDIFQVPLKVLKIPHVTIPTYSNDTKRMRWLNVTLDVVQIDMNEGAVIFYIQLSHATSNISCGSQQINSSSCQHGVCSHLFDISKSPCASSDILVTTFATNRFGDGPKSKSILGGENSLVNIEFDHTRQAFVCNFLNATTNGIKSCTVNVTHGNNCEKYVDIHRGVGLGDSIAVEVLNLTGNISDYCFDITAQSGTSTIAILVTEVSAPPRGLSQIVLPVSIEVIFTIVAALVIAIVVLGFSIACCCSRWKKRPRPPLHIIKISVTNTTGALLGALAVFKGLGISVRFINTCAQESNERRRTFLVSYNFTKVHASEILAKLRCANGGIVLEATEVLEGTPLQRVVVKFSVKDEIGELVNVLEILRNFGINLDNLDGGDYRKKDKTRRFAVEWECSDHAKLSLLDELSNNAAVIDPKAENVQPYNNIPAAELQAN